MAAGGSLNRPRHALRRRSMGVKRDGVGGEGCRSRWEGKQACLPLHSGVKVSCLCWGQQGVGTGFPVAHACVGTGVQVVMPSKLAVGKVQSGTPLLLRKVLTAPATAWSCGCSGVSHSSSCRRGYFTSRGRSAVNQGSGWSFLSSCGEGLGMFDHKGVPIGVPAVP
jgi:hypothetical protein